MDHLEWPGGGATGGGYPEDSEGEERPLRSLARASETQKG